MENNYITPNPPAEQRLTLAIIKAIRRLSHAINRIITKLEDQTEWFAQDLLYSQQKEINFDLAITENVYQIPSENKTGTTVQTALANKTNQWQYPLLTRKRSKAQLSLDYLLAISG